MSKDAFSRLPRELTKLFDDHFTRSTKMQQASDLLLKSPKGQEKDALVDWYIGLITEGFTFGEKVFMAMVFHYISRNELQLCPGFARMLKVLTRNTHREVYIGTEWEGGHQGNPVVRKVYPKKWNRFVTLAHRFYELEDFNGRIRHINSNLILHLSMCVECGSAILTEENNKSFICSGACRVSFSRSQKKGNVLPLKGSHQKPEVRRIFTELSKTMAENMALTILATCQVENNESSEKAGIPEDVLKNPEAALEWLYNFEFFDITEKKPSEEKSQSRAEGFDIELKADVKSLIPDFKPLAEMREAIKAKVDALRELYEINPLAVLTKAAGDLRQEIRNLDPTNPMGHLDYSTDVPRFRWFTSSASQVRRLNMEEGEVAHPRFNKMKDYELYEDSSHKPELEEGAAPSKLLKYLVSRCDHVDWRNLTQKGKPKSQDYYLEVNRIMEDMTPAEVDEVTEWWNTVNNPNVQIRLNKTATTIEEMARKLPLLGTDPDLENWETQLLKDLAENVQLFIGHREKVKLPPSKKKIRGEAWFESHVTRYQEIWEDDPDRVAKVAAWINEKVMEWQALNFEADLQKRLSDIGNLPGASGPE